MEEFYNKHYIRIGSESCIIDGWSDGVLSGRKPTYEDICINEQGGYQFRLLPDGEENPPLFDGISDIPLYKWDGKKVVPRTEQELAADREAYQTEQERLDNLPTQLDRVEAQVTYTAMLTDTLLSEEGEDDV